jgi:hypothetical protein
VRGGCPTGASLVWIVCAVPIRGFGWGRRASNSHGLVSPPHSRCGASTSSATPPPQLSDGGKIQLLSNRPPVLATVLLSGGFWLVHTGGNAKNWPWVWALCCEATQLKAHVKNRVAPFAKDLEIFVFWLIPSLRIGGRETARNWGLTTLARVRAQPRIKTPIRWRESPTNFPNCSYVAPAACASRSARRKRSRACSCAAAVSRSCRSASMTACRLAARSDTASRRRRGMRTRFDAAGSAACETLYSRIGCRVLTSLLQKASANASAACGSTSASRKDRSPAPAPRTRTSRGSKPVTRTRQSKLWPSSRPSSAFPPTTWRPGSTATRSPASTPSPGSARRSYSTTSRFAPDSSGRAATLTANGSTAKKRRAARPAGSSSTPRSRRRWRRGGCRRSVRRAAPLDPFERALLLTLRDRTEGGR